MINPKTFKDGQSPAQTTLDALESVWKDKGWKLSDADGKPTTSADKATVEGQE